MYHYYIFHKPAGCITALRDPTEPTILKYLNTLDMTKLRPVGRLDRDTEGLLILTDDGAYNQHMTHPDMGTEKEYFFWAMGIFSKEKKKKLETGVQLAGKILSPARPAKVTFLQESRLMEIHGFIKGKKREHILKNRPDTPVFSGYITVTEGRKHEVKRLLKSVGCCCIYLKRVRMGNVVLPEDLNAGEVREFIP
ncbi:MAG: pseudouridine synthase [Lachnospiraceae bacterium]|nr:pseudouridine synthase [Lachnospiraceae bacterium]